MSRFRLMTLLPEMGFDVFGNPSLIHRSQPHIGCTVVPDNPDIQVAGWLSSSLRLSTLSLCSALLCSTTPVSSHRIIHLISTPMTYNLLHFNNTCHRKLVCICPESSGSSSCLLRRRYPPSPRPQTAFEELALLPLCPSWQHTIACMQSPS